jgi:hypothetical protein
MQSKTTITMGRSAKILKRLRKGVNRFIIQLVMITPGKQAEKCLGHAIIATEAFLGMIHTAKPVDLKENQTRGRDRGLEITTANQVLAGSMQKTIYIYKTNGVNQLFSFPEH